MGLKRVGAAEWIPRHKHIALHLQQHEDKYKHSYWKKEWKVLMTIIRIDFITYFHGMPFLSSPVSPILGWGPASHPILLTLSQSLDYFRHPFLPIQCWYSIMSFISHWTHSQAITMSWALQDQTANMFYIFMIMLLVLFPFHFGSNFREKKWNWKKANDVNEFCWKHLIPFLRFTPYLYQDNWKELM